jgi:hypothetical protein
MLTQKMYKIGTTIPKILKNIENPKIKKYRNRKNELP